MKRAALLFLLLPALSFAVNELTITGGKFSIQGGQVAITNGTIPPVPISAIVYDTRTVSTIETGDGSPASWNITIGSLSNRYLLVGCGTNNDNSVSGVTVGGNAMLLISSSTNGSSPASRDYIYGYVAPPSGSQTISASFDGGASNYRIGCGAIAFSGVDQSSPIDVSTRTYASAPSVTFTTTVDNEVLFDAINQEDSLGSTPTAPQAKQWEQLMLANSSTIDASTRSVTTAGSYSMSWSSLNPTQQLAVGIRPAP